MELQRTGGRTLYAVSHFESEFDSYHWQLVFVENAEMCIHGLAFWNGSEDLGGEDSNR